MCREEQRERPNVSGAECVWGSVVLWLCGSVALRLCGSVALLCGSAPLWLSGSVAHPEREENGEPNAHTSIRLPRWWVNLCAQL